MRGDHAAAYCIRRGGQLARIGSAADNLAVKAAKDERERVARERDRRAALGLNVKGDEAAATTEAHAGGSAPAGAEAQSQSGSSRERGRASGRTSGGPACCWKPWP